MLWAHRRNTGRAYQNLFPNQINGDLLKLECKIRYQFCWFYQAQKCTANLIRFVGVIFQSFEKNTGNYRKGVISQFFNTW